MHEQIQHESHTGISVCTGSGSATRQHNMLRHLLHFHFKLLHRPAVLLSPPIHQHIGSCAHHARTLWPHNRHARVIEVEPHARVARSSALPHCMVCKGGIVAPVCTAEMVHNCHTIVSAVVRVRWHGLRQWLRQVARGVGDHVKGRVFRHLTGVETRQVESS